MEGGSEPLNPSKQPRIICTPAHGVVNQLLESCLFKPSGSKTNLIHITAEKCEDSFCLFYLTKSTPLREESPNTLKLQLFPFARIQLNDFLKPAMLAPAGHKNAAASEYTLINMNKYFVRVLTISLKRALDTLFISCYKTV